MKACVLKDIIRSGKTPAVKINDQLWDESWGDKGMLADITSVSGPDGDGVLIFKFDYNKYRSTNLPLQSHDWWLNDGNKGTAFEAGHMEEKDITEDIFADETADLPITLVEDGLLGEYMGLKAYELMSYTDWLENRCEGQAAALKLAEAQNQVILKEVLGLKKDMEKHFELVDHKPVTELIQCPHCGGEVGV